MNSGGPEPNNGSATPGGVGLPLSAAPTPEPTTPAPAQPPESDPVPSLRATHSNSGPNDPAYAQQFVASLHAAPTDSKDTGDIILNNDVPKKSHKGLIIGIVIGVVALIVIICLVVFLLISPASPINQSSGNSNQSSQPAGPPNIPDDTKSAFYSYANYVLYGTDSTDQISEQRPTFQYDYSAYLYNGPDTDQAYFDEIYQKYDTFYSLLSTNDSDPANEGVLGIANNYKQLLDFLAIDPASDAYHYKNLMAIYLESGAEAAHSAAEDLTNSLPQDNQYAEDFYDLIYAEYSNTLAFLDLLDSSGCLIGGTIDDSCRLQVDNPESDGDSLSNLMIDNYNNANNFLNYCYDFISTGIWQIEQALGGGQEQ